MTDNDHECNPDEARPPARIDDFLVARHQTRHDLHAILDTLPPDQPPTTSRLRALRRKVRQTGPDAVRELVGLCVEGPGPRTDAALLLLSSFPPADVMTPVVERIRDPAIPKDTKIHLLGAVPAAFDDAELMEELHRHVGASPVDVSAMFSEVLGSSMEPEDIAHLWLTDMGSSPPDEKLRFLSLLAEQRKPELLPILELEAHNPAVELRREIATMARRFRFAEAEELARLLETDTDPTVRYNAHDSIAALRAAGADLPRRFPLPQFDHSYCVASPETGIATLVYVARLGPTRRKFCALMLDTFHRGVLDSWGNADVTDAQVDELIASFNTTLGGHRHPADAAPVGFDEISRDHALFLIDGAVKLAQRRGVSLPADFRVWERLFRHEEWDFDPAGSSMIFDLHCCDCGRPIKPNRRRANFLVQDRSAWCRACLNRKRFCRRCHKPYMLAEVGELSVPGLARDRICPRCRPEQLF